MKAILFKAANQLALEDIPQPQPQPGWATVKISYAGICGGDLNILASTHPRAKAPLVMGHECVGVLESDDVPGIPKGTRVTFSPLLTCGQCTPCQTGDSHVCNTLRLLGIDRDGAFAEYASVPAHSLIPIPDGVSDKLAALAEPVAVAVHALRDTGFVPGDNALVIGGGAIGICTALTLRAFGASAIVLFETDEKRAAVAKSLGLEVVSPAGLDVESFCKERTGGNGYDWVFDCAGVQPVADILFDAVKVRGRVVIVALYKKPAALPLIKGVFKEASMHFVRVYRLKDFSVAVDMLANHPEFEKIITHTLPISQAGKGFDLLTTPGTGAIKVLYDFT